MNAVNTGISGDPLVLVLHAAPLVSFGVVASLERQAFEHRVVQCTPEEKIFGRYLDSARVVITDYEQGMRLCEPSRTTPGHQGPRVLVISHRSAEHDIRRALSHGVRGYLVSGFPIGELSAGVRALWQGRRYISNAATASMVSHLTSESLTPREADVLHCLVDGYANKHVGQRLEMSAGTVKTHVQKLFSKLGVSNRADAAATAVRLGILPRLDPPGTFELAGDSKDRPFANHVWSSGSVRLH